MIAALVAQILPWLLAGGAAIGLFFGYTAKVKSDERKKQATEVALANASAVMAREKVARTVAASDDAHLRDELRHDLRPPGSGR